MAGIDKTYIDNFKDYLKFKEWADKQFVTFYDGFKLRVGNWVRNLEEEDFANGEIPIMNTPKWLDIYLIQNCKIKFVLNRMKCVYGKEFENLKYIDLSAKPPEEFQKNRKIKIQPYRRTRFPLHEKPFGKKTDWWLDCNDVDFWYNDVTKIWSRANTYYPHNTNVAHISSMKAIIRHLRKQYLPKGIIFYISGKYIGEEYLAKIY